MSSSYPPWPQAVPCSESDIVSRLRRAGCVFAEDEARLLISAARTPADLAAMVDQRADGLPLEHVIGWAEFCGLRIAVDPGVFVPRRRTEFLVGQAASLARQHPAQPPLVIVDLCCGSGAVAAALTAALAPVSAPAPVNAADPVRATDAVNATGLVSVTKAVELYAVDIDPVAVRCARRNVAAAGGQVWVGDLYQPLPPALRGRVAILTANVPYVPTEAVALLPPEARIHEQRIALDGGADGLDMLRRVAAEAPSWLAPGGHLLAETSAEQAPLAVEMLARGGLTARSVSSAEFSATVVIATRPHDPDPG